MPDPATRTPHDPRYNTARWRRLRARILHRDGCRCTIPGCQSDPAQPRGLHVDHVIEVNDGGPFWDEANLRTLCRAHHSAKTLEQMTRRGRSEPRSPNA